MALRVIEGGRAIGLSTDTQDGVPGKAEVACEAERRLQAIGYLKWRNREAATGMSMPREVKYLAMQIGYVAQALSELAAIPQDFRSDIYWPASEAAAWRPTIKTGP